MQNPSSEFAEENVRLEEDTQRDTGCCDSIQHRARGNRAETCREFQWIGSNRFEIINANNAFVSRKTELTSCNSIKLPRGNVPLNVHAIMLPCLHDRTRVRCDTRRRFQRKIRLFDLIRVDDYYSRGIFILFCNFVNFYALRNFIKFSSIYLINALLSSNNTIRSKSSHIFEYSKHIPFRILLCGDGDIYIPSQIFVPRFHQVISIHVPNIPPMFI